MNVHERLSDAVGSHGSKLIDPCVCKVEQRDSPHTNGETDKAKVHYQGESGQDLWF